MWNRQEDGFALLEVVVALGLLTVSTLVIAEALGASIEYARAADLARRATFAAAAVTDTTSDRVDYPPGWRNVGAPGADGLPGSGDDTPIEGPEAACRRRVTTTPGAGGSWVWVEATCWPEDGVEQGTGAPPASGAGLPAGTALRIVTLTRAR